MFLLPTLGFLQYRKYFKDISHAHTPKPRTTIYIAYKHLFRARIEPSILSAVNQSPTVPSFCQNITC